jgi:hypothetical protein
VKNNFFQYLKDSKKKLYFSMEIPWKNIDFFHLLSIQFIPNFSIKFYGNSMENSMQNLKNQNQNPCKIWKNFKFPSLFHTKFWNFPIKKIGISISFFGYSMNFLWNFHGIFGKNKWKFFSMKIPKKFHGNFKEIPCKFLWNS